MDDQHLMLIGDYGDDITVKGEFCIQLSYTNLKNSLVFALDDIVDAVQIMLTLYESSTSKSTIKSILNPFDNETIELFNISVKYDGVKSTDYVVCHICSKQIRIGRMKQHIGYHISRKDVLENEKLCGFCGHIGCSLRIIRSSGRGKNSNFSAQSDCKLFLARFAPGFFCPMHFICT